MADGMTIVKNSSNSPFPLILGNHIRLYPAAGVDHSGNELFIKAEYSCPVIG
ncbi:MAG: hypothetical protein ACD_75C01827G0006 [uncultured bacterium]|nr:MAG: hypothetical protein ACD_75C01827G0006 [uncultured bacterium]